MSDGRQLLAPPFVRLPGGKVIALPPDYVGDRESTAEQREAFAIGHRLDAVPDRVLTWCHEDDQPAGPECVRPGKGHRMIIVPAYATEAPVVPLVEPTPSAHQKVLDEIETERRRQVEQHGWDQLHDDRLPPLDWIWLLQQRVTTLLAPTLSARDRRRALLELCAIGEAAIESHDRRYG